MAGHSLLLCAMRSSAAPSTLTGSRRVPLPGEMHVVQLTPTGSACSITFGVGVVDTPPGSVQALHLVVSAINAARAELVERGVEVGEVQDFGGVLYASFSDPDGKGWALQQLPHQPSAAPSKCSAG